MQRIEVKSSMFKSVGYDPKEEILEVEFSNGVVYQYKNFTMHDWTQFRQQESLGGWFARNIRNKFTSKRMEPEDAENSAEKTAAPSAAETKGA